MSSFFVCYIIILHDLHAYKTPDENMKSNIDSILIYLEQITGLYC